MRATYVANRDRELEGLVILGTIENNAKKINAAVSANQETPLNYHLKNSEKIIFRINNSLTLEMGN